MKREPRPLRSGASPRLPRFLDQNLDRQDATPEEVPLQVDADDLAGLLAVDAELVTVQAVQAGAPGHARDLHHEEPGALRGGGGVGEPRPGGSAGIQEFDHFGLREGGLSEPVL